MVELILFDAATIVMERAVATRQVDRAMGLMTEAMLPYRVPQHHFGLVAQGAMAAHNS